MQAGPFRPGLDSDPLASQRGFTLAETLVGLAITAEVLLVALLLFDVNSRIARNQVQVADMQQSQRIAHNDMVRVARAAGRGGLRQDVAVVLTDDADPTTDAINGNEPVDGSDILTVRGVISSPMYQIRQVTANYTPATGPQYDDGGLVIESISPTGIEQPFDALDEALDESSFGGNNGVNALILVSATSDAVYAVVEIRNMTIANNVDLNGDGTNDRVATIRFARALTGNAMSADFADLNPQPGVFPAALDQPGSVGFAGLVEEYRFYIRDDSTAAGGYAPKLSRARFYPSTDRVYGEAANSTDERVANSRLDIAENVLDLQVALGIDADGDGVIEDATNRAQDEWLYNDAADSTGDFDATDLLFNLSLTTLARTDRIDRNYQSEAISSLGNHDYSEPIVPTTPQQRVDRSYRRQVLTTLVDLRNVN